MLEQRSRSKDGLVIALANEKGGTGKNHHNGESGHRAGPPGTKGSAH